MHFGLFSRRERYGLTLRGWLVSAGMLVAATAASLLSIYPFLAVTNRTSAEVLVVEGWIHDYAIRAAAKEFTQGHYKHALATGGPIPGLVGYLPEQSTAAGIGAGRLTHAGIPPALIQAVPSSVSERDRTYHSALALRDWFIGRQLRVTRINIITEDVHARRTRLLFEEALGPRVQIGIISVPNPVYDPKRWWSCSEGVRDVLGETISYIYAKFFFFPPATPTVPLDVESTNVTAVRRYLNPATSPQ